MKSRLVINPIVTIDDFVSSFDWARLGDGLVVDASFRASFQRDLASIIAKI